jgi:mannosyltransferase OCH1-like enzyme
MPELKKIKKVHQIFWDFKRNRTYEDFPEFKEFVDVTKNFCAEHGYRYKMWSKQDCNELIEQEFPEYKKLWDDFRMDIQRCDFIRYCIIYKYGGLYLDCDVKPIANLDRIFETDQYFVHWNDDKKKKPYNAIMFGKKKNPLFLEIIKESNRSFYEKVNIKIYETWTGRFVFQTTGHTMLERVFKNNHVQKTTCIHDVLYVYNSSKTYGTKQNFVGNKETALFQDNNASVWYREI